MEKCGTAPKLNLTESSFIKISTSNPEHSLFRFMILILEFNMFHNILFISLNLYNFNNLPWVFFKMRPNLTL